MTNPPRHIVQTSREAKKEFKKYGPRLSEAQLRQQQRTAELEERADRARQQEERKRIAKKKREQKEQKEREARRQLGVGLATQMIGNNHTQAFLKNQMEAFLGYKKREAEEKAKEAEVNKKLADIAEQLEKEPWDDGELDNLDADDIPGLDPPEADSLIDEDLDDETLLELQNIVTPDLCQTMPEKPVCPPPAKAASPTPEPQAKEDPAFTQKHGPINHALEKVITQLPGPVVELLSVDASLNRVGWDAPTSLLYKLNPPALPPHRLRLKVGCIITAIRDIRSSSNPLAKDSHLRILKIESEQRMECLALDGKHKGCKTLISRFPFKGKYRNDEQFPFQRLQFPVRVCLDYKPTENTEEQVQPNIKAPSKSSYKSSAPTSINPPQKPSNTKPEKDHRRAAPTFKVPSIPASKSSKTAPQPPVPTPLDVSDDWACFFESGTQIARQLSSEENPRLDTPIPKTSATDRGVDIKPEDLEDFASTPVLSPSPIPQYNPYIPSVNGRRRTVSTSTIQLPPARIAAPPLRPTTSSGAITAGATIKNVRSMAPLDQGQGKGAPSLKRKAEADLSSPMQKKRSTLLSAQLPPSRASAVMPKQAASSRQPPPASRPAGSAVKRETPRPPMKRTPPPRQPPREPLHQAPPAQQNRQANSTIKSTITLSTSKPVALSVATNEIFLSTQEVKMFDDDDEFGSFSFD